MKIKYLTKVNCTKLGIVPAPQFNFEDDGNYFKGFLYKDIPLTQNYSRSMGECFLDIRVDYLKDNFSWLEWVEAGGSALSDKFNGVSEIDTEDLINTLEAVIKLRDELNAKCTAPSERDWGRLEERIHTEVLEARSFLHKVKQIEWWELTDSQLYKVRREMKCILNRIEYYTVEHIRGWDIGPQREQIKKMNNGEELLGISYSRRELEKYL